MEYKKLLLGNTKIEPKIKEMKYKTCDSATERANKFVKEAKKFGTGY